MMTFRGGRLGDFKPPPSTVWLMSDVAEAKGRQELYTRQSPQTIANAVCRAVREGQGRTLAEAADRMGVDAPPLSRLETGKMLNPTIATLYKWAEALGQKLEVNFSPGPSVE